MTTQPGSEDVDRLADTARHVLESAGYEVGR